MSVTVTIILCILLLLSYIFDFTASKTRIPSALLLLIVGVVLNLLTSFINIKIPNIDIILPILGNIGLILIVLEGVMEIELSKNKLTPLFKSIVLALIPLLIFLTIFTFIINFFTDKPLKIIILNIIPLSVISSAIVIPTVKGRQKEIREIAIYESSISDILGVLLFNIVYQSTITEVSILLNTFVSILIVLITSFLATVFLSRLIHSIDHSVKFTPIIIIMILVYAILKVYHLPALIFILTFGLILNNLTLFKSSRLEKIIDIEKVNNELPRFKDIIYEGTFLIRSIFFILFGYSINLSDLKSISSLIIAIIACILIYAIRLPILKILKLSIDELLTLAPRGLITILLFISIQKDHHLYLIDDSVIIQVIVITILIMSFANIKKTRPLTNQQPSNNIQS